MSNLYDQGIRTDYPKPKHTDFQGRNDFFSVPHLPVIEDPQSSSLEFHFDTESEGLTESDIDDYDFIPEDRSPQFTPPHSLGRLSMFLEDLESQLNNLQMIKQQVVDLQTKLGSAQSSPKSGLAYPKRPVERYSPQTNSIGNSSSSSVGMSLSDSGLSRQPSNPNPIQPAYPTSGEPPTIHGINEKIKLLLQADPLFFNQILTDSVTFVQHNLQKPALAALNNVRNPDLPLPQQIDEEGQEEEVLSKEYYEDIVSNELVVDQLEKKLIDMIDSGDPVLSEDNVKTLTTYTVHSIRNHLKSTCIDERLCQVIYQLFWHHKGSALSNAIDEIVQSISDLIYDEMVFSKVTAKVNTSFQRHSHLLETQGNQLKLHRDQDLQKLEDERSKRLSELIASQWVDLSSLHLFPDDNNTHKSSPVDTKVSTIIQNSVLTHKPFLILQF